MNKDLEKQKQDPFGWSSFNFRNLQDRLDYIAEEHTDKEEINFNGYQTYHYDMCPGASELYGSMNMDDLSEEDKDIATRSVRLQDTLFYMEKIAKDMPKIDDTYIDMMQNLEDQIMEMAKMLNLEKEHDYLPSHIEAVKELQKEKM